MPPLYPPEYPYRPDAPLLSLGPAFSEEIARSLVRAIWHENPDQPHETDVRTAAGLTMLEAFHPRDQLECMLAAQGVAAHCAIMDTFRCAADPRTPPLLAIKLRANAVSLNRMFCTNLHELTHLQSRPLPPRPGQPPVAPPPGDPPPAPEASPVKTPRARTTKAARPTTESEKPAPASLEELPEDIETRPDGTPGNLTAYAPKAPVETFIPREAPIMVALATRPKPWRMVNVPDDQEHPADPNPPPPDAPRGPVDPQERIFTGDALARFAATRLDPNAPIEPLRFDDDYSLVELELISTGGDPSAEAEKAALMAAHPEGKPIVTLQYGTKPGAPNQKQDLPPDG